jgi:hypothetical protein
MAALDTDEHLKEFIYSSLLVFVTDGPLAPTMNKFQIFRLVSIAMQYSFVQHSPFFEALDSSSSFIIRLSSAKSRAIDPKDSSRLLNLPFQTNDSRIAIASIALMV